MSYCVNPDCTQPKNLSDAFLCQSCGSRLLVRNRYRVTKSLGQGGFGATFVAVDMSLPGEPICVLKQLRPSNSHEKFLKMARELFEREARTLGKIGNHPQIPRLLDYFEDRQSFYLVQDFVSGITLHQEIRKEGLFNEAKIQKFLIEILPIIQYVHSKEIIHRDIKPANIIRRDQDNKLVLIDFGAVKNEVSKLADQEEVGSGNTAFTQFAVGTSGYAPPEQLVMRPVFASDIYSLGITCIYLMTGKSPKDIENHPSTGEMMWQKYVQLGPILQPIISKMLESSVKHRYQSAEQVLRALELAEQPFTKSGMVTSTVGTPPNSTGDRTIDRSPTPSPPPAPPSPSPGASPVQKLAKTIRENRDRAGSPTNLNLNTTNPSVAAVNNTDKTSVAINRKREITKMDANSLLKAYQRGQRTFNDLDITGANLPKANLPGVTWENTNCSGGNLQNANLGAGKFTKTNFTRACLRGANLSKSVMDYANLQDADLRGADLSESQLSKANLQGTNLCGANLRGVKMSESQLGMAKTNFLTVFPNGKRGGFW
jgi:serine/threonine protein kinase, bacterial